MADIKQVPLLRTDVSAWNDWRNREGVTRPELRDADLHGADLRGAHLWNTNFGSANLEGANLDGCSLWECNLSQARIGGAKLTNTLLQSTTFSEAEAYGAVFDGAHGARVRFERANLRNASFVGCNLDDARFNEADLSAATFRDAVVRSSWFDGTNFSGANLTGAKLQSARLHRNSFREVRFGDADLSHAMLSKAELIDTSLHDVRGLETVSNFGSATVDLQTFYRSAGGNVPAEFWRGCGAPDALIAYVDTLSPEQPIQFCSCFISYSSKDSDFATKLYRDLQYHGVRCWYAPQDLRAGDRLRPRIDEVIQVHDKVLLILSSNSLNSSWVEKEVETTFEQERFRRTTLLFPLRLDEEVMSMQTGWAADIRRTRHIADFSSWTAPESYETSFRRLLRDLRSK